MVGGVGRVPRRWADQQRLNRQQDYEVEVTDGEEPT